MLVEHILPFTSGAAFQALSLFVCVILGWGFGFGSQLNEKRWAFPYFLIGTVYAVVHLFWPDQGAIGSGVIQHSVVAMGALFAFRILAALTRPRTRVLYR